MYVYKNISLSIHVHEDWGTEGRGGILKIYQDVHGDVEGSTVGLLPPLYNDSIQLQHPRLETCHKLAGLYSLSPQPWQRFRV